MNNTLLKEAKETFMWNYLMLKEDLVHTYLNPENQENMVKAIKHIDTALKAGKKIFIAGNGGSAAEASHFAAELMVRFKKERKPIPCICLNTDNSIITAYYNDYEGGRYVFRRQLDALASSGDVLILLSTSWKSQNIIHAAILALGKHMTVVALGNQDMDYPEGAESKSSFIPIKVMTNETARVQEIHLLFLHTIAECIENEVDRNERQVKQ